MERQIDNNENFEYLLTEEDKRFLGIDLPSFNKRMKDRLNKFRGNNENPTEDFLVRHNYYAFSHTLA